MCLLLKSDHDLEVVSLDSSDDFKTWSLSLSARSQNSESRDLSFGLISASKVAVWLGTDRVSFITSDSSSVQWVDWIKSSLTDPSRSKNPVVLTTSSYGYMYVRLCILLDAYQCFLMFFQLTEIIKAKKWEMRQGHPVRSQQIKNFGAWFSIHLLIPLSW